MKFTHLNQHQRYQIEQMLGNGKSIVQIALYIGVHRSTVYRELKRCSHLAGELKRYDFKHAQQHADALQAHSSGNQARKENINGLIRQYIPKDQSLKNVSAKKIKEIEDCLNHRPRKTLGYRTPYEVLFSLPPAPVAIEG